MTEKYKVSYAQVEKILRFLSKEERKKIPQEILLFLDENKNEKVTIRRDKPLIEQDVTEEAKAIIANLYRDYLATEYEKARIIEKQNYDIIQRYNLDNIFNNRNKQANNTFIPNNDKEIIEYKESILKMIIRKIKEFFI